MSNADSKVERPLFVALFAGVGCFLLSFVAMGLAPWTTLSSGLEAPPGMKDPYHDENGELTAAGRGRKIYMSEACWHCHSQFVRPVANEPWRYGPKSEAWEAMFDVPNTYGTRRIGPDLAREAGRRTDDWHFAHLLDPRSTVPRSVMPPYPWLFDRGPDGKPQPGEKAKDLVAYLQSLGSAFKQQVEDQVYPREIRITGSPVPSDLLKERGAELYAHHCVGCHGENHDGVGRAADFLKPSAANLNTRYLPRGEVYRVLYQGVRGSAMPSYHDMGERQLWALAQYVSDLGQPVRAAARVDRADVLARGREIYSKRCASCHGEFGEVPQAMLNMRPAPKDLRTRLYDTDYLIGVVRMGRPGTGMVPTMGLSAEEEKDLAAYVRSMFKENVHDR
ncbi:hypothetical protein EDM80_15795 [bacterium]|nr:MAG: hypothetical protein EDM80_15795 [bacterium]RIK59291.1 MAG: hypothetical protein DCC64_15950 [Planctomycetota bacterium]